MQRRNKILLYGLLHAMPVIAGGLGFMMMHPPLWFFMFLGAVWFVVAGWTLSECREDIAQAWRKMRGKNPASETGKNAENVGDWKTVQYWDEPDGLDPVMKDLSNRVLGRHPKLMKRGREIRELQHPDKNHWSNQKNLKNNSKNT